MDGEPVIRIEGLWFAYGSECALEDVNLSIKAGDFVSIVGPNGGGKTTLVRLMLGLLEPDCGTVRVFGGAPAEARSRIGYLPQRADLDRAFPVSVMDVALMGRLGLSRRIGPYGASDRIAALRALAEVGVAGMERRPFSTLSGGQRQRVLIARALACEPEVLLLDEPTAGLDARVQDEFYGLMRELSSRLTVVLVSHDVGFVSTFVRTVVCVNRSVHVHSAADLSGESIIRLYGRDVRMVRHGAH